MQEVIMDNIGFKDMGIDLILMLSRDEIISNQKKDDDLCIIQEKV